MKDISSLATPLLLVAIGIACRILSENKDGGLTDMQEKGSLQDANCEFDLKRLVASVRPVREQ